MRQTGVKELLYFQLGKMMSKSEVEKLKKSSPSRGELQKLKDSVARFLIGRIVSAE
jgi:hypothetical protein